MPNWWYGSSSSTSTSYWCQDGTWWVTINVPECFWEEEEEPKKEYKLGFFND